MGRFRSIQSVKRHHWKLSRRLQLKTKIEAPEIARWLNVEAVRGQNWQNVVTNCSAGWAGVGGVVSRRTRKRIQSRAPPLSPFSCLPCSSMFPLPLAAYSLFAFSSLKFWAGLLERRYNHWHLQFDSVCLKDLQTLPRSRDNCIPFYNSKLRDKGEGKPLQVNSITEVYNIKPTYNP